MFNPQDPEFIQDPYPVYRALREQSPMHHSEALGGWVLTRYADVQRALNHRSLVRPPVGDVLFGRLPPYIRHAVAGFEGKVAASLPFANPPEHTRLRATVARAFNEQVVDALRPVVERRVRSLLDRLSDAGRGELLEDYGYQIPTWVIMELVGIPQHDLPLIKDLVTRITPIIGQSLPTDDPVGAAVSAAAATEEFSAYLDKRIAERRAHPKADLLTALMDSALTPDELTLMVLIMLIAGTETTTHYITNAIYTLLRHPEQLRRWRENPELDATAAEELLRFEPPVPITTPQLVAAPVEIGGRWLEPDELVYPVIGAANRDPAVFARPDELDLARPAGGGLAFGGGIHFCIGRHLARMESQVAISAIVRRFPGLRLDDAEPVPVWRPDPTLRGLLRLPVITG